MPAAGIASLADLVSPENFKRILRHRYEMSAGKENVFNKDLARSLVEIAYAMGQGRRGDGRGIAAARR